VALVLYVRGLRAEAGGRIAAERARAPFASLQDLVDRTGLRRDEQRMLAEVGALNGFGLTRRSALWQVEKAGRPRGPLFREVEDERGPSPVPEMDVAERMASDLLGTGLTVGPHPMALYRETLAARGVRRAADIARLPEGTRVRVAGPVICRQRPGTAKGFLFLTLEDETGLGSRALVAAVDDLVEQVGGVGVVGEIADLVDVEQARSGVAGETAAKSLRPARAQVFDQLRGGGAQDREAGHDRLMCDVPGDHGLAEAVGADQGEVASLTDELERERALDEVAFDLLGPVPVEVSVPPSKQARRGPRPAGGRLRPPRDSLAVGVGR
jgi:hypothetical protein